ncbi:C6 zinc finger domain-containing protein [Histoplasma capsulatum G186AR]|uniref:C6 zinc finger domain-containing protein n=2 Tax=Ajellomyces capsulatus TaxID=5037 RepID=C0NMJ1_AJECG|nr:C6 zinc finger domain-containing protein [Histoplasma capsulatum G186AR]EEH07089.1 C6 zinc finger domain-containing protein [Histoplasma capsulatum G186AR]KAG5287788.1 C6 zinc finger domain-containing protein [Histoplasma capsulatum]QSS70371.1 C6 zinc finger domain-containing protein [Histoplasma capsulatum G186AR]
MAAPLDSTLCFPTQIRRDEGKTQELAVSGNRIIGNQVVFRVENARRQRPNKSSHQQAVKFAEPTFHSRQPHRKSRSGCSNCKKRRIKCDETKPGCSKCDAYGITCDYSLTVQSQQKPKTVCSFADKYSKVPGIEYAAFSLSMTELADKIDSALGLAPNIDNDLKNIAPKPVNRESVEAFYHFLILSSEDNALSDTGKKVTNGAMLRIAFQIPYLMHAILGVATSSRRRLLPWISSIKIAESYHWQRAITLYKKELSTSVGAHNMDGLMSTCMLMGVLSFSAEEYKPESSWLFSSDPKALNWLLLQSGLRHLLEFTSPYLHQSIWYDVFIESNYPIFEDHRPGADGLHPGLAEICEIDEKTTEETNPYHWPLRMLSPLLELIPSRRNFPKITSFMGRLPPDYTALLEKKDPRAVLILGYWLGKKCQENHWWMHPRVHAECTAVCMFLENNPDPRILKLLEYPAENCGYLLNHVREQAIFEANIDFLCLF